MASCAPSFARPVSSSASISAQSISWSWWRRRKAFRARFSALAAPVIRSIARSHGVLVATNINDLVEATVTAKLVKQRALDPIQFQNKPYDVVAQHVVGMAALAPIEIDEAFALDQARLSVSRPQHAKNSIDIVQLSRRRRRIARADNTPASSARFGSTMASISLAHPRIAREFLVNIGTIVSEGFVDVLLKRRRLGSVEEGFIKQLQIGDLFVLADVSCG